jgi:hypothetical protein
MKGKLTGRELKEIEELAYGALMFLREGKEDEALVEFQNVASRIEEHLEVDEEDVF